MCQGNCSQKTCQGACSPDEAHQALRDIQSIATQQLATTCQLENLELEPAQAALTAIEHRASQGLAAYTPPLTLAEKIRKARAERPHTFLITPRLIKRRADDGPISGQAITDRMMALCGCNGRYDCACVSCENKARIELWTEHNTKNKKAEQ